MSLDPDSKLVFQSGEEFGNRHSRLCDDKKIKLFFALQTLNENDVEVENQPGRPA